MCPFRVDYRNSGHLKLCLLCEGIAIDWSVRAQVGRLYTERSFAYNNSGNPVQPNVPGELLLPGGVVCGVYLRPGSPWSVTESGEGALMLRRAGVEICPVEFPPRPAYYDVPVAPGVKVDQLVTQFSIFALALFLRRSCHFWLAGQGCHFCSVEPTRRQNRHHLDALPETHLREAVGLAFDLDHSIRYLELSGGAHPDLDTGFLEATGVLARLRPLIPPHVRTHLNILPPWNLNLLERLGWTSPPSPWRSGTRRRLRCSARASTPSMGGTGSWKPSARVSGSLGRAVCPATSWQVWSRPTG